VGMNFDASGSTTPVSFVAPATNDSLTGTIFADNLRGGAGNDLILGGDGDDYIEGNMGDDIVLGGGGNDTLIGGGGNNVLEGEAGTDTGHWNMAPIDFVISTVAGTSDIVVNNTAVNTTNIVRSIETLRFAGVDYAVQMDTTEGDVTLTGATTSQALFGRTGNDILNGQGASDILVGGEGDDRINGGNGNDWIFQVGATDGRDRVNGGDGVDTYILSGTAGVAETFNIYTVAALPGALAVGLDADTEIVITRNGVVIAELDNIEEIKINSLMTTQQDGNGVVNSGTANGDTIAVFGNFDAPFTSLLYNTIRINGTAANDTVDISGLQSDHRIVFTTNGGADTVMGSVRAQDTINGSVTDLRSSGGSDFGAQDGLGAMVGGELRMAALFVGSGDSETAIDRTMIETDDLFPLDTVETGPVAPVFVNDAPVDLGGGDQRSILTDYPVS